MQRGILLFLGTLVLGRTAVIYNKCEITRALNDKLLYDKRMTYMGDYFPKDYKIFVRYEEVLRCQNITSLINQGITVKELRYLWGITNEDILIKIKKVLPDRHPSIGYVMELLKIFKELLLDDIEIQTEIIQDIMEELSKADDVGPWKSVRPKALLDNCFRVLHALYEEECNLCNPRSEAEDDTLCPPETIPPIINSSSHDQR